MEAKVLSLGKFSVVATGDQGSLPPPFWFTKNTFLEHHVTTRKLTMIQEGIITLNPTNLTISSMLKFLNYGSVGLQV